MEPFPQEKPLWRSTVPSVEAVTAWLRRRQPRIAHLARQIGFSGADDLAAASSRLGGALARRALFRIFPGERGPVLYGPFGERIATVADNRLEILDGNGLSGHPVDGSMVRRLQDATRPRLGPREVPEAILGLGMAAVHPSAKRVKSDNRTAFCMPWRGTVRYLGDEDGREVRILYHPERRLIPWLGSSATLARLKRLGDRGLVADRTDGAHWAIRRGRPIWPDHLIYLDIEWFTFAQVMLTGAVQPPQHWLAGQAAEAVEALYRFLRPEAAQVAEACGELPRGFAGWAAGPPLVRAEDKARFGAQVERRIQRRAQAVATYPFLIHIATGTGLSDRLKTGRIPLYEAIDAGQHIADRLTGLLGVPSPVVDAMRHLRGQDLFDLKGKILRPDFLSTMAAVPADRLPGRGKKAPRNLQWRAFVATQAAFEANPESPLRLDHMLRGEPIWHRPMVSSSEAEAVRLTVGGVAEALLDVAQQTLVLARDEVAITLGLPPSRTLPKWPADHPALHALIGARAFGGLEKLSGTWHRDLIRLEDAKLRALGATQEAWFPISAPTVVDAVQVIPLANQRALQDEGREMEHCVGTYAARCAAGRSHILSLRDAKGRRISTADIQIHLDERGLRIEVREHQAKRNTPPPRHAADGLRAWIRSVESGELAINPDAVLAAQQADVRLGRDAARAAFLGGEAADALFLAYRKFLAKEDRKLTRAQWLAKHNLREIFAREIVASGGVGRGAQGPRVGQAPDGPEAEAGFGMDGPMMG